MDSTSTSSSSSSSSSTTSTPTYYYDQLRKYQEDLPGIECVCTKHVIKQTQGDGTEALYEQGVKFMKTLNPKTKVIYFHTNTPDTLVLYYYCNPEEEEAQQKEGERVVIDHKHEDWLADNS